MNNNILSVPGPQGPIGPPGVPGRNYEEEIEDLRKQMSILNEKINLILQTRENIAISEASDLIYAIKKRHKKVV